MHFEDTFHSPGEHTYDVFMLLIENAMKMLINYVSTSHECKTKDFDCFDKAVHYVEIVQYIHV